MKYNIGSNRIQIFPSVDREQCESTKLTEARIARITNQLVGFTYNNGSIKRTSGFVYPNGYTNVRGGQFSFNILGYKFEISEISELINKFSLSDEIWAYISLISLDTITNDPDYFVLHVLDDNDVFSGLTFSDKPLANAIGVKLLEKDNSDSWKVPTESYNMLNRIPSHIDGGEVGEIAETYSISYDVPTIITLIEPPRFIQERQTLSFQISLPEGYTVQSYSAENALINMSADGTRFIISNATGNVTISIEAAIETHYIYFTGLNCFIRAEGSLSGCLESGDPVYQGETIIWTAEPYPGFKIDGESSGAFVVNHEDITINVSTYAICNITNNLFYCINSNPSTYVRTGASYDGVLKGNAGYLFKSIPDNLVLMGGEDITHQVAYIEDYYINISISNVTDDLIINAEAFEEAFLTVFPNNLFYVSDRYYVGENNAIVLINLLSGAVIPDEISQANISGATLIDYIRHDTYIELHLDNLEKDISFVAGRQLSIYTNGHATVEPNISMIPCDKDEYTFTLTAVAGFEIINALPEDNCCTAELYIINGSNRCALRLSEFTSDIISITVETEAVAIMYSIRCSGGIYATVTPEQIMIESGNSCTFNYELLDDIIPGTEVLNVIPSSAQVNIDKVSHIITVTNVTSDISINLVATIGDYVTISYGSSQGEGWYIVGAPVTKVIRGGSISIRVGVDTSLYKPLTKDDFYLDDCSEAVIENLENGVLTISNITDNLSIHADVKERDYTITWIGTHISPTSGTFTIQRGTGVSISFIIDDGYAPGIPYVIPAGAATLDFSNNGIVIISNVISDCNIYYEAGERTEYSIAYALTGCSIIGTAPDTILEGGSCVMLLSSQSGYYPLSEDKIRVQNANFTYINGTLTISNPTGMVTIQIVATEIVYTIVVVPDSHITFDKTSISWYMAHSSTARFNYEIEDGYHLSKNSIQYDKSKCTLILQDTYIEVKDVHGDATIIVESVEDAQQLTVTAVGTYCSPDRELVTTNYGGFANITFTANNDYNILYGPLIINNSESFIFESYDYHPGLPDAEIRTNPVTYNGMEFQLVNINSDFTQGTLYINNVTTNLNIKLVGSRNIEYAFTVDLNNCHLEQIPPESIKTNETVNLYVKADEWYSLDNAIIEEK